MAKIKWRIDDQSPGRYGFGPDGGEANEVCFGYGFELHEAITEILGDATPRGDGSIERTLPTAHPFFPWLTALAITSIRGLGAGEATLLEEDEEPESDEEEENAAQVVDAEPDMEVPPIVDSYFRHPIYELGVRFGHRPWAILSDDSIALEKTTIEWTDEDNLPHTDEIFPEWLRYTDWTYEPGLEIAYAQFGQMQFRRGDGTAEGSPSPHLYFFSGYPRVPIPRTMVQFLWVGVPYEYITSPNSLLVRYQGYINQLEFYGWDPGMLLYHSPRIVRRYGPPVPEMEPWEFSNQASTRKLVDVMLLFEETYKTTESEPETTSANYLAKGHNLEPWLHEPGKFFYVASTDVSQRPKLRSFPFQLLFQDPDS